MKKVMFVSHCLLNQSVRPIGMDKYSIKEILDFFSEAGIGIIQIPCPQVEFNGGLQRKQKLKEFYDNKFYRKYCRKISIEILNQIERYKQKNFDVLCILGVEFSTTCGVHQIEDGNKSVPGKGIFIEELEDEMRKRNFQVPILGINLNNLFSSLEKLQTLLKYS